MKLTSALIAFGIAAAAHLGSANPAAAGPVPGAGLAGIGAIGPADGVVGSHGSVYQPVHYRGYRRAYRGYRRGYRRGYSYRRHYGHRGYYRRHYGYRSYRPYYRGYRRHYRRYY